MSDKRVYPGNPYPLGATWDGRGVNFAIYSENATRVELCLVDKEGTETRIALPERTAFVWHGYVPGIRPKQLYVYRLHGPYEPEKGLRFNPDKVLFDPYGRALVRPKSYSRGAACGAGSCSLQAATPRQR